MYLIETNYVALILALSIFIYTKTYGDTNEIISANMTKGNKFYYIPNLLVTLFSILFCFTTDSIIKFYLIKHGIW